MTPKVSIIVPCYNSEKWIEQCVVSALTQDYDNIEVICIDNESTDNSMAVVEEIKRNYPELITGSAPNIYPHCWDEARSAGLEMMTGDYVLTMAFQSPVKGMREDQQVYTGEIKHIYQSLDEFKRVSLARCPVNTPTVIFNRKLYDNNLLKTKPDIYGGAADYDLYCRLADNNIFIYPAPTWLGFYYRWHPDQATWQVHKEAKDYDKMIQSHWKDKWKI